MKKLESVLDLVSIQMHPSDLLRNTCAREGYKFSLKRIKTDLSLFGNCMNTQNLTN